jgi:hypothetical protein
MALGALTVSLGLDAAEFISGLTKSEQAAKKFGAQLDRAIATGIIKATIALEAFGAVAKTAFQVFESLTEGAAKFQDLAETTGAAAEDLAGFAVAAATAGVGVDAIGDSMIRLTKNLTGVDDESKAAGAALGALGLNVSEFKQLDPAAQYEAVGKALAGFADGAGKSAVAVALFGKAGAEQLKVFKALEEQGGRMNILTERQIALSDAYKDQQAKTRAELTLFAQAAASEALPALVDLTAVARDFARELLGIDSATGRLSANNGAKAFAEAMADAFAFAADQVDLFVRIFQVGGKAVAGYIAIVTALARGSLAEARAAGQAAEEDINRVLSRITFADRLAQQRQASRTAAIESDPRELARRGRPVTETRPALRFEGVQKAQAAVTDEAQKYLESLQKQLQSTYDLTTAEKVLADIQAGRLKLTKTVTQDAVVGLAREIDAMREAQRIAKERSDARQKDYEAANDAARANEQADRDRLRSLLSSTPSNVFKKQQDDIEFVRQAYYDLKISVDEYGEAVTEIMGKTATDTKEAKSAAEELGMTFSSAFEDAIVGGKSLSEVLKALDQDITRILIRRLVTEPLANSITSLIGGSSGGSGDGIGSIIASILGSASGNAMGGPIGANSLSRVAERGPETFSDGSSTYLLTGNRGGYIDPKPGGGSAQPIVVNVQMPPGGNRETALQWGEAAGRQLRLSMSRNG